MGDYDNMAPGIMKGIYSVIGPQIKRRQGLEDELRSNRADAIYKTIENTPNLSPEEIDRYLTEIESLYPKAVKEIVKQSHDKIRQMQRMGQQNQAKQQTAQADAQKAQANAVATDTQPATSAMPVMPGAASATSATPSTSPIFSQIDKAGESEGWMPLPPMPGAQSTANPMIGAPVSSEAAPVAPSAIPPPPSMASPTAELLAKRSNVNRGAKINRESISESMDYWKTKLPEADDNTLYNMAVGKQVMPSNMKITKAWVDEDGYPHYLVQSGNEIKDIKSDYKTQEKTFAVRIGRPVSITQARDIKDKIGTDFKDENGTSIDLDKLTPEMAIYPIFRGSKTHYVIQSQRQPSVTVGNIVYAVPEFEKMNMPSGSGVALGMAQVGRATTREQMAITPEGQPIVQTMRGGSVPATTGITGRPTAGATSGVTPGAPMATRATSPVAVPVGTQDATATPAASGQPAPTSPVKPSTPAERSKAANEPLPSTLPAGARPSPGMPTAIYNTQQKRIVAVREASNQVFGDPSQPEFVALKAYADLASNKEASARVATAVNATFDSIDQEEKTHGSIVNLLKRYAGIPQALVQAKVGQMQSIIPKDPHEHAAYTATINAYSNLVALRILTGASAHEFSVKAIQQELPILGYNVHTPQQFYGMLAKIAEDIWGGARTTVKGMFPEDEIQYYKAQVGEMTRLARSGINPPPGAGSARPSLDSFNKK